MKLSGGKANPQMTNEILKKLLANEKLLSDYATKFSSKIYDMWEDKKNFQAIYEAIEKAKKKRARRRRNKKNTGPPILYPSIKQEYWELVRSYEENKECQI